MQGITDHMLAADLGEGVRHLDRDHADMMSLAAQFSRLREKALHHQAVAVLAELLATAEAHWRREVDMLHSYGYPEADDHAAGHLATEQALAALAATPAEAATGCEDVILRMLIEDQRWKWWFLDAGIRPRA